MFGEGRDLPAYEASLRKLQEKTADIDLIYASHGDLTVSTDTIDKLLVLASEINHGLLPDPVPAPDNLPEEVKIYGKDGVRLYLQL